MPNDPVQSFWNSVFVQVQEKVHNANKGSGPKLKFEAIPSGFRVYRKSPPLVVERWLSDNCIHGRSEEKDKSGDRIHSMFVPLTITGHHEACLPPDSLKKFTALCPEDVACGVIDLF